MSCPHLGGEHNSEIRQGMRKIGRGETLRLLTDPPPEIGGQREHEKYKHHPLPRRERYQYDDVIPRKEGVSKTRLLPEWSPVCLLKPRMDYGEIRQENQDGCRRHMIGGKPLDQVVTNDMGQENVEQRAGKDRWQGP